MKRLLAYAVFSVVFWAGVMAIEPERVKMSVSCPTTVAVGDKFDVVYQVEYDETVNADILKLDIGPIGRNAVMLYGPAKSTRMSYSKTNAGGMVARSGVTWLYKFRAVKEGEFEVPDFVLTLDSDTISNLPSIDRAIQIVSDAKDLNGCDNVNRVDSAQVVLKLELDKDKIQLGDSIECSLKLVTNASLSQGSFEKALSVDDCYLESMSPEQVDPTVSGGYAEYEIERYRIIPLKKGRFVIEPVKISGTREKSVSPVSDFGFADGRHESVPFEAETERINFEVY